MESIDIFLKSKGVDDSNKKCWGMEVICPHVNKAIYNDIGAGFETQSLETVD